jgi:hypothetical protein
MTLITKSVVRPNVPDQEFVLFVCSRNMLLELTRALAEAITEAMVPGKLVELCITEEAPSEKVKKDRGTFSMAAELTAIVATQCRYGGCFISQTEVLQQKDCRNDCSELELT